MLICSGVEKIGTIRLDIGRSYKRQAVSVNDAAKADIKIVIKLGSDRGVLVVEALHNRTVVGTASIDYTRSHIRKATQMPGLI